MQLHMSHMEADFDPKFENLSEPLSCGVFAPNSAKHHGTMIMPIVVNFLPGSVQHPPLSAIHQGSECS